MTRFFVGIVGRAAGAGCVAAGWVGCVIVTALSGAGVCVGLGVRLRCPKAGAERLTKQARVKTAVVMIRRCMMRVSRSFALGKEKKVSEETLLANITGKVAVYCEARRA
jgi:hypothetical protein